MNYDGAGGQPCFDSVGRCYDEAFLENDHEPLFAFVHGFSPGVAARSGLVIDQSENFYDASPNGFSAIFQSQWNGVQMKGMALVLHLHRCFQNFEICWVATHGKH